MSSRSGTRSSSSRPSSSSRTGARSSSLLPVVHGASSSSLFFVRVVVACATAGPDAARPRRIKPLPPPGVHMPGPVVRAVLRRGRDVPAVLRARLRRPSILARADRPRPDAPVLGPRGARRLRPRRRRAPAARRPSSTPDRRPASTCPARRSGRSSPRSRVAVLFAGLVFGGWLLGVGVVVTIVTLLGWLSDARKEYRHVVEADRTGHLDNEPAPGWPKACSVADRDPRRRVGRAQPRLVPAARRPRAAPRAPGGSPGAVGGRRPARPARSRSSREDVKFDKTTLTRPGRQAVQDHVRQPGRGTPHDVDILDAGGKKVFDGKDFPGPADQTYDVPPSPAGTYKFDVLDPPGPDDRRADRRRLAWALRVARRRAGDRSSSRSSSPSPSTLAVIGVVALTRPGRRPRIGRASRPRTSPARRSTGRRSTSPTLRGRPVDRQLLGPVVRPLPDRVPAPQGEARRARRRRARRRRRPDGRSARPRPDVRRRAGRDVADRRSTRTGASRQAYRVVGPAADLLHRPGRDPPVDPDRRGPRRRLRAPVRPDLGRLVTGGRRPRRRRRSRSTA